jgi:hypothetical protein
VPRAAAPCYDWRVIRGARSRLLAVATVGAAVLAAWLAAPAHAEIDGDRFLSRAWRVRLTAPRNWQLTDKTAYPSVLLRMVRRAPDGKMLLTAEKVAAGVDALAYAIRTAELLRTMRFEVRAPQLHASTGAYFIDMHRGSWFLRQAFLVAGGIGYSLTLSAPDNRTRSQHLRAFDAVMRSVQVLAPEELEELEHLEDTGDAEDAEGAAGTGAVSPGEPRSTTEEGGR